MKLRNILINICLMAFCAFCAVGTLAMYHYGVNLRRQPQREANQSSPKTEKEMQAAMLSGIDVGKVNAVLAPQEPAKPEIVLFLRTGCIHCQNSLPLYREMMNSDAVKSHRVVVTAIFSKPDTQEMARKYVADNKLGIQHVVADQTLGALGIQGTPTVLAVKNGKIVASWFGDGHTPAEVIKEISKLS